MTQWFRNNVTVDQVERSGGHDRYGNPLRNVVAVKRRGRLEKRTIRTVDSQGKAVTIDGTLQIAGVDLQTGDKLILDDESQWEIFNEDDALDIQGQVLYRVYGLTRRRKKT